MKQTARTRKLNETTRETLATIIHDEVSDPRLDFVTVTAVRVAPDLMVADVYVTAHGGEERYAEVLAGLESAKGRIRSLLGQTMRARFTPELRFRIDESVDESMRIAEALKNVPPSLQREGEPAEEGAPAEEGTPAEEDAE